MTEKTFKLGIILSAGVFLAVLLIHTMPAAFETMDIIGAFAAGFVNPFAAGYSTDVIMCWFILLCWVLYEAKTFSVRGGWIACLLGIFPGVAVGFALYLLLRQKQLATRAEKAAP